MKSQRMWVAASAASLLMATAVRANNVSVQNITVTDRTENATYVSCDVGWENSWRATWTEGATSLTNWDAAWVFIKYRVSPSGAWKTATLSTNKADHIVPAGVALDVGLTSTAGKGAFIYRAADGNGSWTNRVKLCWNFKTDGLVPSTQVDVAVHAIEMVYVPAGSFYIGDNTTSDIEGQFENGTSSNALLITSEGQLTLGGGSAGSVGNHNKVGQGTGFLDDFDYSISQTLPAAFPKGSNAFYCMKYEISQGQYTDFLNSLTSAQASTRFLNKYNQYRNTISGTYPTFTNTAPDRACNYLMGTDLLAYADWSGLRPMTELEFEKACRGPVAPVANEMAFGSANYNTWNTGIANDGTGTDTIISANGNNFNSEWCTPEGPFRCGIYATAGGSRLSSGATYWGIMEMSGNVVEICVPVGIASGRAFTGAHGDGVLDVNGNADAFSLSLGLRGGGFYFDWKKCRVSSRQGSSVNPSARWDSAGGRAVRTAP